MSPYPARSGNPGKWVCPFAVIVMLAACGGKDASAPSVPVVTVATVDVRPLQSSLIEGRTAQLTVTLRAANGSDVTGVPVSWTSSDPEVATVTESGVVTAKRAGTVTITASAQNRQGSAQLSVIGLASLTLTKASGDAQTGIAGFALADSIRVLVMAPDASSVANLNITFTASAGALSPSAATTDAAGVVATQWTPPAAGTPTLTATLAPGRSTSFTATVRDPIACSITNTATFLHEGPTDYTVFAQSQGVVKAIMLLGDFSDMASTETPDAAAGAFVPGATSWYTEASYGRMTLDVTVHRKWLRLSQPAANYAYDPRTGGDPYRFVRELVTLADAEIDFSQYTLAYFVPVRGASILTVALSPLNINVISADGKRLRYLTILGADFRFPNAPADLAQHGMAHETAHQFGLPDLYSVVPNVPVFGYVGYWDVMSSHAQGAHFFAWHKQKLGWLQAQDMVCLETGGVEAVVQPIETSGGLKAVAIRTAPTRVIVAEVRRRVGRDARLGDEGVLVYSVDGTIGNGNGPIRILPSTTVVDPAQQAQFGPFYNATFGVTAGKSRRFQEAATGVTIDVVAEVGSAYRLRVRRP
jgi:M6 family metalloprotease-like protein